MGSMRAAALTFLVALSSLVGCAPAARVVVPELPIVSIFSSQAPKEAIERPTVEQPAGAANSWTPKAAPRPWRWIVIHHSATAAGSATEFDRSHRARGWDELGYHFVINNGRGGKDGLVEIGSRWTKQKWGAHCKTPDNRYNDFGVGICLVGNFENGRPTAAQLASLQKLVVFLSDTYGVGPADVIGHGEAPGTNTACPGKALARHLQAKLSPYLLRRSELARR